MSRARIDLRVTTQMHSALEILAQLDGCTMSDVIRSAVAAKAESVGMDINSPHSGRRMRREPHPDIPALEANVVELRHIGRNVNQLARRAHGGSQVQLEELTELIRSAVAKVNGVIAR